MTGHVCYFSHKKEFTRFYNKENINEELTDLRTPVGVSPNISSQNIPSDLSLCTNWQIKMMFNNKLTNTQLSNYLQAAKKQGTTFGVPSPSPLVPRVPPETTAPFGGVDFPTENDDSSAKTSMPPVLLSTIS